MVALFSCVQCAQTSIPQQSLMKQNHLFQDDSVYESIEPARVKTDERGCSLWRQKSSAGSLARADQKSCSRQIPAQPPTGFHVTTTYFDHHNTSSTQATSTIMVAPKSTPTSQPAVSSSKRSESTISPAIQSLWNSYNADTSPRLKLIDAFLVFIMLSGISQFLYCILVTNFPFNAFLAGSVLSLGYLA